MAAADAVPAIYTIYTALIAAGGISVGAILSSLNDWGKDRRSEKREIGVDQRAIARERATRREETSWRWYENRATFERDTALELQQELYDYGRAFTLVRHADEMSYRKSGKWGIEPAGDAAEDFRVKTVAINRLRVRLFDATLREHIMEFRNLCGKAIGEHGSDPADAKQARKRAQDYEIQAWVIFDTINEQLGTTIRKAFESLDPYQVSELPQFPSAISPPVS
jgi:hypothetical protein